MLLHVPVQGGLLAAGEAADFTLYWLLSCVDHPVHSQIMGALEGPSTILTDEVPLICVMFSVAQQLLLQAKQAPT